jgi:hypothetical protein
MNNKLYYATISPEQLQIIQKINGQTWIPSQPTGASSP